VRLCGVKRHIAQLSPHRLSSSLCVAAEWRSEKNSLDRCRCVSSRTTSSLQITLSLLSLHCSTHVASDSFERRRRQPPEAKEALHPPLLCLRKQPVFLLPLSLSLRSSSIPCLIFVVVSSLVCTSLFAVGARLTFAWLSLSHLLPCFFFFLRCCCCQTFPIFPPSLPALGSYECTTC
jgi:hypothetical protein